MSTMRPGEVFALGLGMAKECLDASTGDGDFLRRVQDLAERLGAGAEAVNMAVGDIGNTVFAGAGVQEPLPATS
ncbi:MAG: hypothetical protein JWL85_79 [Candidatus Saccharibacteria bacterium]|nr:hypothetical protein [Candidatus Saccharibacteria bacterium]